MACCDYAGSISGGKVFDSGGLNGLKIGFVLHQPVADSPAAGERRCFGAVVLPGQFTGDDFIMDLFNVSGNLNLVILQNRIGDACPAGQRGEGDDPHDHAYADLVAGETVLESFHDEGGGSVIK